jgi:hypothetical protein
LGLWHINPTGAHPDRHLFLFATRLPLADIRSSGQAFTSARPSTLDGFDNPRFSQRRFERPWPLGWGMTVDIGGGTFATGLPEVIATQLSLASFECRYIGPVSGSHFGTDDAYLAILAPGADLDAMADALDAAAA